MRSCSLTVLFGRLFVGIIAGRMVPNIWALPCPLTFNDSHPHAGLVGCQSNVTVRNNWIDLRNFMVDMGSTIPGFNPTKSEASIGSATSLAALSSLQADTLVNSFPPLNESGDGSQDFVVSVTIVPFLLIAAFIFACYFFGPSLYRRLLKNHRKLSAGPGFGFDGITKAQLKAVRLKEENGKDGDWYIKLPEKPPTLVLKQVAPLTPIQLLAEHGDYDWKVEK